MSDIAPALVGITLFLVIGWIIRIVSDNRRRQALARTQAELHAKLLEKFGTADEALRYLGSDAGQRLLDSAALERANPLQRILGSVQAGILLAAVGFGLLLVRGFVSGEAVEGLLVLGTLVLVLGLGFLASAGAAWALSRRFGLLGGTSDRAE